MCLDLSVFVKKKGPTKLNFFRNIFYFKISDILFIIPVVMGCKRGSIGCLIETSNVFVFINPKNKSKKTEKIENFLHVKEI